MSKIKNVVANAPIYVGMLLKLIADKFFNLGFNLHITFKTEAGLKLKEVNEAMEQLKHAVKLQAQAQRQGRGESKLADIILGDADEQPLTTIILPKKPPTDH